MSIVRPFRALRPAKDKAHLVSSLPVDFYPAAKLQQELKENPYSFLHIVKPDAAGTRVKPGSPGHLKLIRDTYKKYCKEGILIQDTTPAFYLYRQTQPEQTFTGIVACASVNEYLDGTIKKHEQTLSRKEEKLKEYLSVCSFNAEPVSLTYPADNRIDNLCIRYIREAEPVYDFTTTDKNRHQLWMISSAEDIQTITESFASIPAVYIADGHHRSASSARLAQELQQKGLLDPESGFNYFMAIYFPDHQLKIYEYNRVVKDLGKHDREDFLQALSASYLVEGPFGNPVRPPELHTFSMYLDENWYLLRAKPHLIKTDDPAASLDTAVLTDTILTPLLGITDLRNDSRVHFVPGTHGLSGISELASKKKCRAGFGLFPVSMQQLLAVADAGKTMPPKSTWIEPKLRNGLVVYSLEDKVADVSRG